MDMLHASFVQARGDSMGSRSAAAASSSSSSRLPASAAAAAGAGRDRMDQLPLPLPPGIFPGGKASQMLGMVDPGYQPRKHHGSTQQHHQSQQTHTSLKASTLKKARSLFSSSSNSSKARPGDADSLPSPPPLPHVSFRTSGNNNNKSDTSRSLAHSKSYGSLQQGSAKHPARQGAGSASPTSSYRFPSEGYPYGLPLSSQVARDDLSPPSTDSQFHSPFNRSGGGPLYASSDSSHRKASAAVTGDRRANRAKHAEEIVDEEENCPVCLESLGIRLHGEKPHVVPVCGHKLHADCFETAYSADATTGVPNSSHRSTVRPRKKGSLGICGICRSEMKISEDSGHSKSNKFAAILGQDEDVTSLSSLDLFKSPALSQRAAQSDKTTVTSLHDPTEDHDIINPHQYLPAYLQHIALSGNRVGGIHLGDAAERVTPSITVQAEHHTLTRPSDPEKKVYLTCMVTVQVPSRVPGARLHEQATVDVVGDSAGFTGSLTATSKMQHQLHGHLANNSQSTILAPGERERIAQHQARNDGGADPRRESNATTTANTDDFPTSPSVSAISSGAKFNGPASLPPRIPLPASLQMDQSLSASTDNTSFQQTPISHATSAFTTPMSKADSTFSGFQVGSIGGATGPSSSAMHARSGSLAGEGLNLEGSSTAARAEKEREREAHGPFAEVVLDLTTRMADWKGHQPSNFGSLRMWDSLHVKKDRNVREFIVYLFEEALLCVVDDRKKESESRSQHASHDRGETNAIGGDGLRLKGRVFVKHMHRVEEKVSLDGGMSLTIHMEDDSLDSFVILFQHRETLEVWRSQIQALIDHHRPPITQAPAPDHGQRIVAVSEQDAPSMHRDSIFSSETGQSELSRHTKATSAPSTAPSAAKSTPANGTKVRSTTPQHRPTPLKTDDLQTQQAAPPVPALVSQPALSTTYEDALANWQPPSSEAFAPVDLMIILTLPSAHVAGPSSSALKLRLIRSTLEFVVSSVGPRARISFVTFTPGDNVKGALRKTPWLSTGRVDGVERLEQAISEMVGEPMSSRLEGLTSVDPREDKVTVTTAVNLALDIVLQRRSKSAVSSILLLSDGRDGAQKQQIDLVLARADAGRVAINTFGWGKAHDPTSLWLLSNHTRGSYTFVREYYQLKEALAGFIGGLVSVAVCEIKLHLSVQEPRWFRIRKVAGVPNTIVSADGKDADVVLGELRYGEKKEMLIEVEMAAPDRSLGSGGGGGSGRSGHKTDSTTTLRRKASLTATDDFFVKRGMDPHSFDDLEQDFIDEIENGMADDVPIFDVNATFRGPFDHDKATTRLPYPALLTTTVLPPEKTTDGRDAHEAQQNGQPASNASTVTAPSIVRRRMELLTSDMITRTLLLMSRRQEAQAQRLMAETTRIFGAIIANLSTPPPPPSSSSRLGAERRDARIHSDSAYANQVLLACLTDVEHLRSGCSDPVEFDQITRNYGAQQAVALRDQRAWTARTATEALFFCKEWTAIFGKATSAF